MRILAISILLLVQFQTLAGQTQAYLDEGCDRVMEKLLTTYLSEHQTFVNELLQDKYNNYYIIDKKQIRFCGVHDLEQGTWSVTRYVKYCIVTKNDRGQLKDAQLFIKTQGDYLCENEKVVSFEDIWLD